jgi:serine/threonine protein kinase
MQTIGEGGFAKVKLAQHRLSREHVAIKVHLRGLFTPHCRHVYRRFHVGKSHCLASHVKIAHIIPLTVAFSCTVPVVAAT